MRILARAVSRYGIRCYAYCLMGNHYHLVFDTPAGNISEVMHYINGVYAQGSNRRCQRSGHVFEGRFRALIIDKESYLRRVARYVVLNPVRSSLVVRASAWPWSSYRATAGLRKPPAFLYLDWIDWSFSASRRDAQHKYRLFVNNPVSKDDRVDLNKLALGPPSFESGIRAALQLYRLDRPLPRQFRTVGRPALETLFGRDPLPQSDRDQRMVDAHVRHGYRLVEIARYLKVHPSTVSVSVRRVEQRRNGTT
jgi:REP element-mobilizing transposase RayT